MNVTELNAFFKRLADENSPSFIETSDVRGAMERAYMTFRRIVSACDPWFYATSVDLTVSGQTYNLASGAVTVMGATPTAARMERLLLLEVIDSSGVSIGYLQPSDSLEEIIVPWSTAVVAAVGTYALKGSTIFFSTAYSGTIRLHYVPRPSVDWTLDGAGDNEWVDDVPDDLQTLIAFIAYVDYYAPRDGFNHQQVIQQRMDLEGRLRVNMAGRHGTGRGVRDTFFGGG